MDINYINSQIINNVREFVAESDKSYYSQVEKTAEDIIKKLDGRPIILICGPSGSGKTTTALALERILDRQGHETHTVSLDNYFKTMTHEEHALASNGKLDLESPLRLDTDLLNRQLCDMAQGKPVLIPKYDFRRSESTKGLRTVERKPGELVILEGIHSLNPEVITIPGELYGSIYVSVRTRLTKDNFVLHPEKIRLIRRMIRDNSHRGRSFEETVGMYESVQRGENLYIMPFKQRAHYEIDSFIAYELGTYKKFVYDFIRNSEKLCDLKQIMEIAEGIDESFIPEDSLIREFIGGSCYEY